MDLDRRSEIRNPVTTNRIILRRRAKTAQQCLLDARFRGHDSCGERYQPNGLLRLGRSNGPGSGELCQPTRPPMLLTTLCGVE